MAHRRKSEPEKDRAEETPTREEEGREKRGRPTRVASAAEPARARAGRTIGGTATSYSSVGGAEEPEEWPERIPEPDEAASGLGPEEKSGPVRDVSFRPVPGGYIEAEGRLGRHIPYTGESSSTRGATFEEDPGTGLTAEEEKDEFIEETLEKRTRRYESG